MTDIGLCIDTLSLLYNSFDHFYVTLTGGHMNGFGAGLSTHIFVDYNLFGKLFVYYFVRHMQSYTFLHEDHSSTRVASG